METIRHTLMSYSAVSMSISVSSKDNFNFRSAPYRNEMEGSSTTVEYNVYLNISYNKTVSKTERKFTSVVFSYPHLYKLRLFALTAL